MAKIFEHSEDADVKQLALFETPLQILQLKRDTTSIFILYQELHQQVMWFTFAYLDNCYNILT